MALPNVFAGGPVLDSFANRPQVKAATTGSQFTSIAPFKSPQDAFGKPGYQNVGIEGAAGDGGGGGGGFGGGGGGGVAAAQSTQQVASLRNEIASRRERANSIFDALTGAVQALAQERRGALESDFQREQSQALEEGKTQSNTLARTFRGRGLGDSSYKVNALDDAAGAVAGTVADLGRQRERGLAEIGGQVAGVNARTAADRASIGGLDLNTITDVDQLMELRTTLDERIREAEVQQAELGTESGFRGQLNKIAPYAGTMDVLKNTLSSLVQSAAPQVVKDRLATAIIGNYAPDDSQTWQQFYNEESRKQTAR